MDPNIWLGVLVIVAAGRLIMFCHIAQKESRLERKVDAVCDLLLVWAQTWGDQPELSRVKLQQVVDHYFHTSETKENDIAVRASRRVQ